MEPFQSFLSIFKSRPRDLGRDSGPATQAGIFCPHLIYAYNHILIQSIYAYNHILVQSIYPYNHILIKLFYTYIKPLFLLIYLYIFMYC